jgi:hypothetical protein
MSPQPISYNGTPLHNINGKYVNVTGSSYSGGLSSNETNRQYGMSGVSSNIAAANSSKIGGGIYYKNKRSLSGIKRRFLSIFGKSRQRIKRFTKNTMRKMRGTLKRNKQRGGYHQYQSNIPNTPSYSTGGHLSASSSALANPVPHKVLSNCTNCVDNYNANTNKGFQFW